MKVEDVYERYQVMPTLAVHMLSVGAVGSILTKSITETGFPKNEIISACLLHDMGNIVKFDLDSIPKGLHIPDVDYWKEVQKKIRTRYGMDEHEVTYKMSRDIRVSDVTLDAITNSGTANAARVLEEKNIAAMFVTYCDYHVMPTAITDPKSRLKDILYRYKNTPKYDGYKRDGMNVLNIADYLENHYSIAKESLDEESVRQEADRLRKWELV